MSYKSYKGTNKYHFRSYKRTRHFVAVTHSDKKVTEGYAMTTSPTKGHLTNYHRLRKNPNPNCVKTCYLRHGKVKDKSNRFSKPYGSWNFCKEDEKYIDYLERRSKQNKK